jgi:hypothetical protein
VRVVESVETASFPDGSDGEAGGQSGETRRICNGTAEMRFAATSSVSPGRLAYGEAVMYDLGSHWLFVDGQCRYWAHVMDQGTVWLPVHEGVLRKRRRRSRRIFTTPSGVTSRVIGVARTR